MKTEPGREFSRIIGRPKICIVTPQYPPKDWGGLARTVENIALLAAHIGLDVHIAHIYTENTSYVLLDENRTTEIIHTITVHRIKAGKQSIPEKGRKLGDCSHTLTLQMMYHSLEQLYLDEKFSLFHSFFLFPCVYITGLLAKRYHIPLIATLVGNDINKYMFSPEKVAACRSGLENANRVVALSQDLLDKAHSLSPVKHKGDVIYNSVSIPDQIWTDPPAKPFCVGFAGIFKYAKGLPYLFKAVAEIAQKQDIILELPGRVRKEEMDIFQQALDQTGIKPFLRLLPPISRDRINDWLMTLHLFVLPSLTEGCPNMLMEAMALGLPCIATQTGANPVLMDPMVSGMIVPWGNSKELEIAILNMMKDREAARSMGRKAREKMMLFSKERETNAWEKIYKTFMEF